MARYEVVSPFIHRDTGRHYKTGEIYQPDEHPHELIAKKCVRGIPPSKNKPMPGDAQEGAGEAGDAQDQQQDDAQETQPTGQQRRGGRGRRGAQPQKEAAPEPGPEEGA